MKIKILVMGLSGAGKTSLARELRDLIEKAGTSCTHFNADELREKTGNWDFTDKGRLAQATLMRELADIDKSTVVICDFIAPTAELREVFNADYTIWLDTVTSSQYKDTDELFEKPTAENIACWVFDELEKELSLRSVKLWEGRGKWVLVE